MAVDLAIHDVRLVDAGTVTDAAWVAIDHGAVVGRGTGDGWRELSPIDVVDGAGGVLTPGFVDIHGHGGGGVGYDDGAAAIASARAVHRAHGTTRAVVSLVTAPVPDLVRRLRAVADVMRGDPEILGAHLEGPFLDSAHRGAHDPGLLIPPPGELVAELLEDAGGTLRQVTLAPELPGGFDALRRFVDGGVVVAVGHTDADLDTARRAFDAGATVLTHAFNGMRGLHHRAPGPVAAALGDPRVTLELIADGVHVHPAVIALAFAAAPGRVALITDAMAAAGAADGEYRLGDLSVRVEGGVARLADGTLAGSTLTQDAALRVAVAAGIRLADAVAALTSVPARAIDVPFGSLAVGATADAVLLDAGLHVQRVWAAGHPVAREG